jgi:MoxR-like ATPase
MTIACPVMQASTSFRLTRQPHVAGQVARAQLAGGRFAASTDDVSALARPTLQHRLILNYRAEAEGLRAGDLVDRLLSTVTP